jgi:hypothetical protein
MPFLQTAGAEMRMDLGVGRTYMAFRGRPTMRRPDYEESSGNVFADLGFRNSKQELLKAKLIVEIYKLLKKRGVTQNEAAKLLKAVGNPAPHLPLLARFGR